MVANVVLHYICLLTKHFFSQQLSKGAIKVEETVQESLLAADLCQTVQMNSFPQPMHISEHPRGPYTTVVASDNLDSKIEPKQYSTKWDADSWAKCRKDEISDRKPQSKIQMQDLPTKWKAALDTFVKKNMDKATSKAT